MAVSESEYEIEQDKLDRSGDTGIIESVTLEPDFCEEDFISNDNLLFEKRDLIAGFRSDETEFETVEEYMAAVLPFMPLGDYDQRSYDSVIADFERAQQAEEERGFLVNRWQAQRGAAAVARTRTIAGKDENGQPFKTKSDYFFAIKDLGKLTPEEAEVYRRVRNNYRDQELLASFDVF